MKTQERRELAYWLTLAFRLEREPRRAINGLVLTADRRAHRGLLDLVKLARENRPSEIEKYAPTLDRLLDAEGRVTAQAFVIDRLLSMGCRLVPITDPLYPPHLFHRIGPDRSPTLLSAAGNPDLWKAAGVAISGSRKSGPTGIAFAREVGRAVARAGEVVVCGLAAGVDREALEGALEAGGRALGIAAEGLFHSRWLHRREVREGRLAIVSEFAPDDSWTAGRAMTRNRTIAGFSSALVIADCVASGGTTDQLEVHRAAGLPVYVRRGPGQGALVDELCRRPGVTPWYWSNGNTTWPPRPEDTAAEPDGKRIECVIRFSPERVQVQVDAPRQLTIDALLDTVRNEYERASSSDAAKPALGKAESPPLRVSENVARYSPSDPVLEALVRAGSQSLSTSDLERTTGLSRHRVQKRLRELRDARRVAPQGRGRYQVVLEAVSSETSKSKTVVHRARRGRATADGTRELFPDAGLGVDEPRTSAHPHRRG